MLNIQQIRKDTLGAEKFIHFNNAGSSLPPDIVTQTMRNYLMEEAYLGGYELAHQRSQAIKQFYQSMATLLHCEAKNIAFTSNATDSYNKALSSIPFQQGDVILTTDDDYVSNQLAFLALEKRFGLVVKRAAVKETGGVSVDSMQELIHQYQPKLVAVTHVPTNSGLVQDITAIGKICQAKGILYLVDACQSAGQMPLDMQEIGCDFLSGTFRKFLRGPRGAGFLYVSNRVLAENLEPLFVDLRGADWTTADTYELKNSARRFELWERSYALLLGSQVAVDYALQIGLEHIERRVKALSHQLRTALQELPNFRVLDQGDELCGIVTVVSEKASPTLLKQSLTSASIHSSITDKGGAQIDFGRKGVEAALRLSPHYYNLETEVERVVEVLREHTNGELII